MFAAIRRSLGAECNWGIRFRGQEDAHQFLASSGLQIPPDAVRDAVQAPLSCKFSCDVRMRLQAKLAGEVASRLAEASVRGRAVTLKLKRKKEGAPEPSKFLGHGQFPGWCSDGASVLSCSSSQVPCRPARSAGTYLLCMHCHWWNSEIGFLCTASDRFRSSGHSCVCFAGICDNLSRSVTLPHFVGSASDIASEAQALLRALRIPPLEIRGVGILVRRLDLAQAMEIVPVVAAASLWSLE